MRSYEKTYSVLRSTLLAVFCVFLFVLTGHANGVEITSAELERAEDGYFLNANFNLQLNSTQEEALAHGVVLYFIVDFSLVKPRRYWFDERVVESAKQCKLSYSALTRRYYLSAEKLFQNFDTLAEAVAALSKVRNRRVADSWALEAGERYVASMRVWMDVSLLPTPFQVNALASSGWDLNSGWHSWAIVP